MGWAFQRNLGLLPSLHTCAHKQICRHVRTDKSAYICAYLHNHYKCVHIYTQYTHYVHMRTHTTHITYTCVHILHALCTHAYTYYTHYVHMRTHTTRITCKYYTHYVHILHTHASTHTDAQILDGRGRVDFSLL